MKALWAACIAGAMTFTGVIWLVGATTPGAPVPAAMPGAKPPDVATSFEPAVPGRFPIARLPE